jgi:predicted glycosyltransferase
LYSHDLKGLGHVRRNLLVAQAFTGAPVGATCLLITGTHVACAFRAPAGLDFVTLPSFQREQDESYRSRELRVPLPELVQLRSSTIQSVLREFDPDVLVVDCAPRGEFRELDRTFEYLRSTGRTRCVFGMRDVLRDPAYLQREWIEAGNAEAVLDYYDHVWIYGDPRVFDAVHEYAFPAGVAAKVRYTGYLDQRARLQLVQDADVNAAEGLALPPDRLVLCLAGGGQDGGRLAEAFLQARLPAETNGLLVTGPFMPPEVRGRLRELAAHNRRVRVVEFLIEPGLLIRHADRVIAMGGYNTVCEVLSFEKPALIVPRVNPRREQIIRAERMRNLGLIDVLGPDELRPESVSEWLARDRKPPQVHGRIDFRGLERIPQFLAELLAVPARTEKPVAARRLQRVTS